MLTTIFFFFSAFCTNANIALMQTHEKEAAERRWRQVDGTIEAEQQRGLVFYYKLTAFDRSWLIHWKLKKVSPSFFLFFLSPYIRLGMNQVVLFFLRANGRSWSTCYGFALVPYFASHILLYWTPSVCLSSFALRSRKEIYFLSTTNNLKVKVLELIIKDTNITKLIIFPCLNLITTEKSEA